MPTDPAPDPIDRWFAAHPRLTYAIGAVTLTAPIWAQLIPGSKP